jgi:hypothetical protein
MDSSIAIASAVVVVTRAIAKGMGAGIAPQAVARTAENRLPARGDASRRRTLGLPAGTTGAYCFE